MPEHIKYIKCGGSYQLVEPYSVATDLRPVAPIKVPRLMLDAYGRLTIEAGYCWDGTSGPVIDRKTNMRAGCVHDALYELMRRQAIDYNRWREADAIFARILYEDGAWGFIIRLDMAGLKLANGKYAKPKQRKIRHTAP
jgi:hypothetical protein